MVSDDDDSDDSSVQVAAKKVAKKGDGFDGFGTPDPFNQNDDDQVDAGEPNAPAKEDPNDDANKVSDDDDSDDASYVKLAREGSAFDDALLDAYVLSYTPFPYGFDEFGTPDPFKEKNDQVDCLEPASGWRYRRSCRHPRGCGRILCFSCYTE